MRNKKGQFKRGYKHSKETKAKIKINNVRYWKGKTLSKEHVKKLSDSHLGQKAWNKGKKASKETIEKNRVAHLGKNVGEESPSWKGDDVGYSGLHMWVRKVLGEPEKCEHCYKNGLKGMQIHWANKSRAYLRDVSDWLRLCASCHKKYDKI